MSAHRTTWNSRFLIAAALLGSLVAAGCTQRDSIVVGAIPDDYRTNHPIIIAEKQEKIDIPVGLNDYHMTRVQRTALSGFMSRYDGKAAPMVHVLVPYGSANSAAASRIGAQFVGYLHKAGVPQNRVVRPRHLRQHARTGRLQLRPLA
jgi:pilus assembly protein CpaD